MKEDQPTQAQPKPTNPIARETIVIEQPLQPLDEKAKLENESQIRRENAHIAIPHGGGLLAAISSPVTHISIPPINSAAQCKKIIAGLEVVYDSTPPYSGWVVNVTQTESLPPSLLGTLYLYQKELMQKSGCRIELVTTSLKQYPESTQNQIKKSFKLIRETGIPKQ